MCKLNKKSGLKRIDPCMKRLIELLEDHYKIVACCCGHGKYPMTIVVKTQLYPERGEHLEILSVEYIPRKKRFYRKDKQGYYYIPEVME